MTIKLTVRRAAGASAMAALLTAVAVAAAPSASAAGDVPSGTYLIRPDQTTVDIFAQHFATGGTFAPGKQPVGEPFNAGEQWRFVFTGGHVGNDPVVFIESIRRIDGQVYTMDTEEIPRRIDGLGGAVGTAKKDGSATQQWIMHADGAGRYTFKNLSAHSPNYLGFRFSDGARFTQQQKSDRADFRITKVGD